MDKPRLYTGIALLAVWGVFSYSIGAFGENTSPSTAKQAVPVVNSAVKADTDKPSVQKNTEKKPQSRDNSLQISLDSARMTSSGKKIFLTITNTSNNIIRFNVDGFSVEGKDGKTYPVNKKATMQSPGESIWVVNLQWGESVTGSLIIDMPENIEIGAINFRPHELGAATTKYVLE